MFTGIIQAIGRVAILEKKPEGLYLELEVVGMTFCEGESISVNGCCLTALSSGQRFRADLSSETLAKTNLGQLKKGSLVNIEPALKVGDKMGGHWLSGHIDRTAVIQTLSPKGDFIELKIEGFSQEEQHYLLPKGSLSIDGISLTVNEVHEGSCQCVIIPHTLEKTNLQARKVGDVVNIEFDYLTRVIHHQSSIVLKQANVRSKHCD
jgi:riboflavin synthase